MCLCIRAYKCIWCQFLMIRNVDCVCVYNCICTCICISICIRICTCNRLLLLSSSRSTTAAITTTTAVTILLDQLRHRKSQQSPLPKGREVLPRRTRSALRRMYWHKQAEQHLAMAVHDVPSRDKEAPVAGGKAPQVQESSPYRTAAVITAARVAAFVAVAAFVLPEGPPTN